MPSARRPARSTGSAPPDLQAKARPRQERAVDTYERILAVTAELLGEVGIERLSTNLVCERAGLTPPALYRYFPNKYALLRELGERLMQAQNELLVAWATPATLKLPRAAFEASMLQMFEHTVGLTQQLPGGVWITRALRAVPALQEVRIGSHRHVTALIEEAFMCAFPHAERANARVLARLSVEAAYATIEMLFDDPELDPEAVGRTLASMIAGELLVQRRGG